MIHLRKLFLILTIFAVGCSSVNVVNLNQVREFKKPAIIYTLPENVIRVAVKVTRTYYQCGPYNRFAKKYLGINNLYTENTTIWKIADVSMEQFAVPDSQHIYVLNQGCTKFFSTLDITPEGFLHSINCKSDKNLPEYRPIKNITADEIDEHLFKDLSVKKILISKIDTIYKKVRSDSGFVKIPEINSKIVNKNLEQKAEEIANQIFDIREEKINILTGDYKNNLNGEALKVIVEELSKIEERYLSLFTTITKRDTFVYYFDFKPSPNVSSARLCKFSVSNGILPPDDTLGVPVQLDISCCGNAAIINKTIQQKTLKKAKKNGLYYRVPELVEANITSNGSVILKEKILLPQYGTVSTLPVDFMKSKKFRLKLNPINGAIDEFEK